MTNGPCLDRKTAPSQVFEKFLIFSDFVYGHQSSLDFLVVQITGQQHPGNENVYERYGDGPTDEGTLDPADADIFLSGNIKFDGCSNWDFEDLSKHDTALHFCGARHVAELGRLFAHLHEIAAERIPGFDRDLAGMPEVGAPRLKWISESEALPPIGQPVLFMDPRQADSFWDIAVAHLAARHEDVRPQPVEPGSVWPTEYHWASDRAGRDITLVTGNGWWARLDGIELPPGANHETIRDFHCIAQPKPVFIHQKPRSTGTTNKVGKS